MTFEELERIDWDSIATTAQWVKTLNDLLLLTEPARRPEQRAALADALDAFADHSASDDLDTITRLDRVARRSARALRMENIAASVEELSAGAADFRDIVKQLDAASASLKKSTSVLRAEKLTAAVSSLTETIASLKALTQVMADDSSEEIARAVTRAVASAQSLRALLEKPGP